MTKELIQKVAEEISLASGKSWGALTESERLMFLAYAKSAGAAIFRHLVMPEFGKWKDVENDNFGIAIGAIAMIGNIGANLCLEKPIVEVG